MFWRFIFDTNFITCPFFSLGLVSWSVVLPRCVSLFSDIEKTWDKNDWLEIGRTFIYDCLVDNLHTSTPLDNRDITSYRMSTSSGRLVDPRVPCRWTPRFLLLPRSWPRTSHDRRRADDPTPAGLASAATSATLLPSAIQRRHAIRLPLHRASLVLPSCRALHIHNRSYFSYPICPTIIFLSVSRSKRWTLWTGTVLSGIREHFNSVCHLSDDALFQLRFWRIRGTHFGELWVHYIVCTYFGDARVRVTCVF